MQKTFFRTLIYFLLITAALPTHASVSVAKPRTTTLDTDSSLKAWWTFDGKDTGTTYTLDKSGNGNLATSTVVKTISGKIGQAALMNGTSDKASAMQSSTLNSFTSLSASAWVKFTGVSGMQTILRKSDGTAGNNNYQLDSNGSNFRFHIGTTASTTVTGTTTIAPNKWYQITGTYDGSNMYLYVNSVQEGTAAKTGTANTSTTNSLFMGTTESSTAYLNGSIDDVRLYSRALSANEVYQLYRLGL